MDNPFLRNEMLWGQAGQRRLAASHVILFGLGGLLIAVPFYFLMRKQYLQR